MSRGCGGEGRRKSNESVRKTGGTGVETTSNGSAGNKKRGCEGWREGKNSGAEKERGGREDADARRDGRGDEIYW